MASRKKGKANQPSKSSSAEPLPAPAPAVVAAGFALPVVVVDAAGVDEAEANDAAPQIPSLNFCFAILSRFGPLLLFASFFWMPALALAVDHSDPKASVALLDLAAGDVGFVVVVVVVAMLDVREEAVDAPVVDGAIVDG